MGKEGYNAVIIMNDNDRLDEWGSTLKAGDCFYYVNKDCEMLINENGNSKFKLLKNPYEYCGVQVLEIEVLE